MRALSVVLVTFLATGTPVSAQGQAAGCLAPDRVAAVRERMRHAVDSVLHSRTDLPGISVHVESPKLCLSWSGTAGVSDLATGKTLSVEQPVRIASNTKTYVAAAILRLAEDGRLSLDDPIAKRLPKAYVDRLRAGGYDPDVITIRHLLSHTSGLYDYAMDSTYLEIATTDLRHHWTRMEQVEFAMTRGRPYGQPGQVYHYADTGYILLGEIVEQLTGQGLGPALRNLIGYKRLGLTSTWLETLEPAPKGVADLAHQYMGGADTYGMDPSVDLYGGGGLVATPKDMVTFLRGLFTGKVYKKPVTLQAMLTTPYQHAARDYRLGIYPMVVDGERGWGHTGFWNTGAFYWPDRDIGVAVAITQQGRGDVSHALLQSLYRLARDAGK
jgi:D-alanyl-D-alanine carboxypeptidase